MPRLGRRRSPRALALRALQEVRLAKMAVARLRYRVASSTSEGGDSGELLSLLDKAERLLEYISVKLEVYAVTGVAMTETLNKALGAAGALRSLAPAMPPQTAALLMEVEEILRSIMATEGVPSFGREWQGASPVTLNEEVREILDEAEAVAKTRERRIIDAA
jgi:division protein CdvB (Snf7/Vps24/ESCRT-III family)